MIARRFCILLAIVVTLTPLFLLFFLFCSADHGFHRFSCQPLAEADWGWQRMFIKRRGFDYSLGGPGWVISAEFPFLREQRVSVRFLSTTWWSEARDPVRARPNRAAQPIKDVAGFERSRSHGMGGSGICGEQFRGLGGCA
jgi:hypothetical protein